MLKSVGQMHAWNVDEFVSKLLVVDNENGTMSLAMAPSTEEAYKDSFFLGLDMRTDFGNANVTTGYKIFNKVYDPTNNLPQHVWLWKLLEEKGIVAANTPAQNLKLKTILIQFSTPTTLAQDQKADFQKNKYDIYMENAAAEKRWITANCYNMGVDIVTALSGGKLFEWKAGSALVFDLDKITLVTDSYFRIWIEVLLYVA